MELYGKKIEKAELMKYVGDISMIADAREGVLTAGRAEGVKTIDVKTGSGLEFTVLPTRGMDIAWAGYKGMPISYVSKTGVVHPAYFEKDKLAFLRSFTCGLLTTCGLTYFGAPCEDEGDELGLHGRISNIPAYDVSVDKQWVGDEYIIKVKGRVQESCVFNENIVLTREITTKLGGKSLKIKDTIENIGFNEQPFMVLYHCNFGYPLVSEDTIFTGLDGATVSARDAAGVVETSKEFQKPTHDYEEQVFYHDIKSLEKGEHKAALYNSKIDLGAYIKFSNEQFSDFVEWKMMGEGDYVVGMEPGTWTTEGRHVAREKKELKFIQPGEVKTFELEIGIIEKEIDE